MSKSTIPLFSNTEKQILQEIMNIAFGSASGNLEDLIGISVTLHNPDVEVLPVEDLIECLQKRLSLTDESLIVEKMFLGNFSGSALLHFPENISPELLAFLSGKGEILQRDEEFEKAKKEVFLEIGDILIGSTVGKISELLKTSVSHKPPVVTDGKIEGFNHLIKNFNDESVAIILKTHFSFMNRDMKGSLMIISKHQSVIWMKNALNPFLEAHR